MAKKKEELMILSKEVTALIEMVEKRELSLSITISNKPMYGEDGKENDSLAYALINGTTTFCLEAVSKNIESITTNTGMSPLDAFAKSQKCISVDSIDLT